MSIWPVQDAKARFSELLDAAVNKGPQIVTRRGVETAVLVPIEEWRRLGKLRRPSLKELLLAPEPRFEDCSPARQASPPRSGTIPVTRYLLDTKVVSELRKRKPHGAVVAWIARLDDRQLFVSAVTLGGLQAGVEMTRKQDPRKAAEIEAWADGLGASSQFLPMDDSCFREWARLTHGRPDDLLEDAMIAATARVHDMTVATRNTGYFSRLAVRATNPFRGEAKPS